MLNTKSLQQFNDLVGIKFQLYNSLFTSLPFHKIEKTGILVSMLLLTCEEGYKQELSPKEIIDIFFDRQTNYTKDEEKLDLLFRFVQYIERQIVLFDALEDAAFAQVNDMDGSGSLKQLNLSIEEHKKDTELDEKLKDFKVRLVLTAHPTQFYPDNVLGIIHDLAKAIEKNNEKHIYSYLQQLGRTPFFKKQKPSPYDEAISLVWYLENVFYYAVGNIISDFKASHPKSFSANNSILNMGFWPGGDRDGNPFVTAEITVKVANALRAAIIKCYYIDVVKMKRRLTFKNIDVALSLLEEKLYKNIYVPEYTLDFNREELLKTLNNIKFQLIYEHDNMFVYLVDDLINKVEIFGLHFASLDIRQESTIHTKVIESLNNQYCFLPSNYDSFSETDKVQFLFSIDKHVLLETIEEPFAEETLLSFYAIENIQRLNGEMGCNRYIISMCKSALNVVEVFALFALAGWKTNNISVDVVPLFETITDLQNAIDIMKLLYENPHYQRHLQQRGNTQTVMLGFSDGTKDGGYLMANWGIYKAKEQLTTLSKQYNIDVVFFDGRGGPPARGGGKTHKFYASLGNKISNKEIQLTIQGQTVSSNFGTVDRARFNLEQLVNAGISNALLKNTQGAFTNEQEALVVKLSAISLDAYNKLKNNPYFVEYLQHVSPIRFYTDTNIGSRPSKRGAGSTLTLGDLRAVPFVGAWSQLKQNVTGYYGVGTALQAIEAMGKWDEIKDIYNQSLFFRTLLDNCEMAMIKSYFPLTAYLKQHPKYGEIWTMIFEEYELTKTYILKLADKKALMENYPVDQMSIKMRERIVLPLTSIQQYALIKIREMEDANIASTVKQDYEKLAMRCSFGIINAGRNSA